MGLVGVSHASELVTGQEGTGSRTFVVYSPMEKIQVSEAESAELVAAGADRLSDRRLCPEGHPVEHGSAGGAQPIGKVNHSETLYQCFHCEADGKDYLESETKPLKT